MLEITNVNGTVIGTVSNTDRIIAANASDIKQNVNALFDKPNVKFVLNLQNVKFIDSTGIGALISILKTARQNDGSLQLCSLQKDVFNLLALMKLDKVFDLLPDDSSIK